MKRILAATAIAATVWAGTAVPSSATTFSLGTFSGSKTDFFGNTVSGKSFTDDYTFTLATFASVTTASITSTFSSLAQMISGLTVSLYRGMVGSGTQLATATAGTTYFNPPTDTSGVEAGGLSKNNLGSGNYYVEITGGTAPIYYTSGSKKGQVKGYNSASYSGTVAVTAVPLPTSVALFGVALAGLGAAGALRRKAPASA